MRKGEKLYEYLRDKAIQDIKNYSEYNIITEPNQLKVLEQMMFILRWHLTDEEFNKILWGENYIDGFAIGEGT